MRVYLDTDVLIAHLKARPEASSLFASLVADRDNEIWTGAMQRAEIVFFMRRGEERGTFGLLSRVQTQPVTEHIVDLGAEFFREWRARTGLGMNDAILAGTVAVTGGRIVTQNLRHFLIPGIDVSSAW